MSCLARRLGRAYLSIGRKLAAALVLLAASAATSAAVALPFWYLATAHRGIFNAAVIGLAAAAAVFAAVRRLAAARSAHGPRRLRAALSRAGGLAAGLTALYLTVWAFASGRPLLGAAGAVALLLAVGLLPR